MSEHQMSKDRLHFAQTQIITLEPIDCSGLILDIGGGGEGVIGLLQKNVVIAIDIRKSELDESPPGAVKVVMDAADMHFHDETFDLAVAFFSLMYVPPAKRERLFHECRRVLQPMGRFLIWDVTIPRRTDPTRDIFVVPLRIRLPHTTIHTSYGAPWDRHRHDVDDYIGLAGKTGFDVVSKTRNHQTFHLALRKMA